MTKFACWSEVEIPIYREKPDCIEAGWSEAEIPIYRGKPGG